MLQLELEQTYWWDAAIEMGDQISWFVELAVKPGQLDNFQALTGEMVKATRRERGVLTYQRFVSTDCKLVLVYEHRTRFTVLGNPSDELSALLDGFGATYLKPFGDSAYTHPGYRRSRMTASAKRD